MTDHPPGPPLLLPGSIARVVCWAVLTDEETAQELAELTPWVTWLKHRYDLVVPPGSWRLALCGRVPGGSGDLAGVGGLVGHR